MLRCSNNKFVILFILVVGCSLGEPRRYSILLDSSADNSLNVVHSTKQLTQKLYNVLQQSTSNSNFVFSPFSITALMAMLHAGANKETLKEIKTSLDFPDSPQALYRGYRSLYKRLKISTNGGNTTFISSNRLYVHEDLKLEKNFEDILTQDFFAAAELVDFSSPTVARRINQVVANDTNNKIKELISPGTLTNDTRLVALNALYFKGAWLNEFQGRATQDRDFWRHGKTLTQIPTMTTEDFFRVADIKELDAKAVVLPYQKNEFDMILLLPNQRDGLGKLEKEISSKPGTLELIFHEVTQKQSKNIVLHLPKFSLSSETDLKQPLMKLGIRQAFQEFDADFTKIGGPEQLLYLSKVFQKGFLEVNEAGSEAGAASFGVLFTPLSIGPPVEEVIRFDHPFVGLIRHIETNLILSVFRKTE